MRYGKNSWLHSTRVSNKQTKQTKFAWFGPMVTRIGWVLIWLVEFVSIFIQCRQSYIQAVWWMLQQCWSLVALQSNSLWTDSTIASRYRAHTLDKLLLTRDDRYHSIERHRYVELLESRPGQSFHIISVWVDVEIIKALQVTSLKKLNPQYCQSWQDAECG